MKSQATKVIAAATDGACSGNPGPGGWGILMRFEDGTVEELGGFEPNTTNNRMELKAALVMYQKLKNLPRMPNLKIRTDSKYLIDGLHKWIVNWKNKNWKTSSGKAVLNQDLWKALDKARLNDVYLEYVKGHSGDPDNERVDQIAVSFSKRIDIQLKNKNTSSDLNYDQKTTKQESDLSNIIASQKLHKLLSRLEIASHFAKNGYCLKLIELADLIDEPIALLKEKKTTWQWRNWFIEPLDNDLWRLREETNTESTIEENYCD